MIIFVLIDGKPQGPMNIDQLRNQMRSGAISMASLAWQEGRTDWVPLSSLPDAVGLLFPPLPEDGLKKFRATHGSRSHFPRIHPQSASETPASANTVATQPTGPAENGATSAQPQSFGSALFKLVFLPLVALWFFGMCLIGLIAAIYLRNGSTLLPVALFVGILYSKWGECSRDWKDAKSRLFSTPQKA